MSKYENKTVLITGAGQGIGKGLARAFAREAAQLVLTDINEATLLRCAEELKTEFGVAVLPIVCDGTDENAVNAAVEQAAAHFGGIHVLINDAQAARVGAPLQDCRTEDFSLAVNSGLYATFFYMRAAFPHLKATRGAVINFASGAGFSGKAGQCSYAAAKEGIRGLTRVAATEWAQYGVNVNVLCPLAMTEAMAAWQSAYPEAFNKIVSAVPMGRLGDPERDFGRICLFLASEDAKYISGETISAQGGGGLRP